MKKRKKKPTTNRKASLNAFDIVQSSRGQGVAKEISKEKWYQFMKHSGDRVLTRLGAQLLITGVVQELEPQRFLDPVFYNSPGERISWAKKRKLAIEAYERNQKELQLCG